jgi:hypothetical protein
VRYYPFKNKVRGGNSIPPITITPELEMGLAIMEEAFRTTEGTRRRMI